MKSERFKETFWPLLPALLRTATFLTYGNSHTADDLVQETMVKAFRSIDSFKDGTHPKSWIYTILKRAHIDFVRRENRFPEQTCANLDCRPIMENGNNYLNPNAQARLNQPDLILDSIDDDQIISALLSLPTEIRWTLLLCDLEGLEQAEAAKVLSVPVGTIKSRAHYGRKMLRSQLAERAKRYRVASQKKTQDSEASV